MKSVGRSVWINFSKNVEKCWERNKKATHSPKMATLNKSFGQHISTDFGVLMLFNWLDKRHKLLISRRVNHVLSIFMCCCCCCCYVFLAICLFHQMKKKEANSSLKFVRKITYHFAGTVIVFILMARHHFTGWRCWSRWHVSRWHFSFWMFMTLDISRVCYCFFLLFQLVRCSFVANRFQSI